MDFHFLRPEWFLMILPLMGLLWIFYRRQLMSKDWASIVDPKLLPYLLIGKTGRSSKIPIILLLLMGLILIAALAGPVWKKIPLPVFEQQSALIILLDLSSSMDASDIKPSRLARARLKLQDLLKLRQEGQTALIAYAATAYAVSPLTDDTDTIQSMISSLATDIMPAQGSRTEFAVSKALELFDNASIAAGDILLMTDGVSEFSSDAISRLDLQGHRLSVISVGTAEGAPIPNRSGGFIKDKQGSIVVAKTDHSQLAKLARTNGGTHSEMVIIDRDIKQIQSFIDDRLQLPRNELSEFKADRWDEFGPWLVLLVVPFAALAFRRGIILSIALLFIILPVVPQDVLAQSWLPLDKDQLWLNQNQRAQQKLEQGEAAEAANLFEQQDWKAAAHYRAGQYQEALQQLESNKSIDGQYNRANTLAHLGRLEDALKTYDDVLKQNPDHEDARYNREQVEQALKKQQQQQQSQQGDQNGEQQQGEQSDQSDQSSEAESDQAQSSDAENNSDNSSSSQNSMNSEQDKKNEEENQQSQPSQAEQEKADQQQAETQAEQQQEKTEGESSAEKKAESMSQQAEAQWLRRIPDNPGGLLRNKFRYQYSRQQPAQPEQEPW